MSSAADRITEYGRQIDFGRTAGDYGRYRAGFPEELYVRLEKFGVGVAGQRVLDLGTGTGYFGRGFARRRCDVVGADISPALMREAMRLDAAEGLAMGYVRGRAEALPFRDYTFEVVGAGQCWHWFERSRAALEARRVLMPGGRLVLANFDWIAFDGNVAEATEHLILKHNPRWTLGGGIGIHPGFARDAAMAGFVDIECFSFDVHQPYTHEAWRGRIRASAGIAASLGPQEVARFDDEMRAMLAERFPERPPPQAPMRVHHRVFAMVCRAPAGRAAQDRLKG